MLATRKPTLSWRHVKKRGARKWHRVQCLRWLQWCSRAKLKVIVIEGSMMRHRFGYSTVGRYTGQMQAAGREVISHHVRYTQMATTMGPAGCTTSILESWRSQLQWAKEWATPIQHDSTISYSIKLLKTSKSCDGCLANENSSPCAGLLLACNSLDVG